MAHELLFNDTGDASMFYVGGSPWHLEGTPLTAPPTAAEGIQAAGLDWSVVKAPLFYHASIEGTAIVPNLFALVPDAGWKKRERPVFGTVSSKYRVLQNREAFAFFDPLVRTGYATYETAGALGDGGRVWVLARLKDSFEVGKGDVVDRYILLSNTHDGHGAVQAMFTPIRVVCRNTLSMALRAAGELFSVRHDEGLPAGLSGVAADMRERIEAEYRRIHGDLMLLRSRPVKAGQVEAYFSAVYPGPVGPEPEGERQRSVWCRMVRVAARNRDGCLSVYGDGPRCRSADGETLWDAYNAVTEYVDHWQVGGRRSAPRLNRIAFGEGAKAKERAFQEAMKLAAGASKA